MARSDPVQPSRVHAELAHLQSAAALTCGLFRFTSGKQCSGTPWKWHWLQKRFVFGCVSQYPPLFEDFECSDGSDYATDVWKCTREILVPLPMNRQSDLALDVP